MPVSFYLIRNAVTWPLSDSVPLEVVSIDGIGNATVTPLTEQGPLQHGDSDLDFRLEPRIINLVLQAHADEVYSYRSIRELINRLFNASNAVLTLRVLFDDNIIRDIDVRSLGIPGFSSSIQQEILTGVGVQLRAANPLFYDPVGVSVTFGLSGGGSAFTVPTPVPTPIGASTIDQTIDITYDGTFDTKPIITIYGPATDPVLTHLTTGDVLDFTGISIPNGSYYTLDLRYGRKLVYKNGDTSDNRIAELTDASNLDTFGVVADPTVPDGINSIRFTATSVNTATQVYVNYFDYYTGI